MKYCELLGCKELAATFCLSDDRVYGDLCGITFQRQGTIGRGSDHCDFYFYRNPDLRKMMMELGQKIIILGCPGSGKSTLAKKLHDATGLPLFHLDAIWWNADKSHLSREEFDQKLHEIFQTDQWIIDGDYSRTYEMRFKSCDSVIFLDYSVDECMRGIKERIGKVRADMPWTEQELDPELVQLVENYPKNNRPVILSLLEKYPDVTPFVFKSRLEASEWLENLRAKSPAPSFEKERLMKFYEPQDRTPLLPALLTLWEASVRATHLFLSDAEILHIKEYVPQALLGVAHLIVAETDDGTPAAFMGVENARLEMLFLSPAERGKGLGRQLLQHGIQHYGVQEVTVNEQNPQAVGFYEHMGFRTYKRTDFDEEGNPYPLLYMKLGHTER